MIKIAIIGSRGVPARYGGFDTLVEEIATRLSRHYSMDVTVYCRKSYYSDKPPDYLGVKCVYLPSWKVKALESIFHTNLCVLHALVRRFDVVMVVDPGNAPFCLPFRVRKVPLIIHTDGLGWKRSKWGPLARKYYQWAELVTTKVANGLVTDSKAMQKYYEEVYAARSVYIPYGYKVGEQGGSCALELFTLNKRGYFLVVARLEPENNIDLIVEEYVNSPAKLPLVVVGDAPYDNSYCTRLQHLADHRVSFLGRIHDQKLLNSLYENAYAYIHGHEVGGTNPSLLRAMGAGTVPIVLDVEFNREAVSDIGITFGKTPGSLSQKIMDLEDEPEKAMELGRRSFVHVERIYDWDVVTEQYATLFHRVVRPDSTTKRKNGN
jgi:glycosyltransferase involved in cell wall biosynthesis